MLIFNLKNISIFYMLQYETCNSVLKLRRLYTSVFEIQKFNKINIINVKKTSIFLQLLISVKCRYKTRSYIFIPELILCDNFSLANCALDICMKTLTHKQIYCIDALYLEKLKHFIPPIRRKYGPYRIHSILKAVNQMQGTIHCI